MNVPETFFSVNEELRLFGLSLVFGAVFGVVYDVFRTARILLPHNSFLVIAEDAVFLGGYGIFLTAFASAAARGELRFYFALGNLIGFALYLATLGSITVSVMRKLAFAVKKLLLILSFPLRKCCVFIRAKAKVKFVGYSQIIVNLFKKIKILLISPIKMLYNEKVKNKRRNVTNVGKKI